jgi:hypothetical protein
MVDRYVITTGGCYNHNFGEYVLYTDYATLEQRLTEQAEAYSKLAAQLHRDVADWHKTADLRSAEIVRLREVLQEIIDMPILYEDAVTDSLRDIARQALGGEE